MITSIISDFSNVLLFVRDSTYSGKLNDLHAKMKEQSGYKVLDQFRVDDDLLNLYSQLKAKVALHLFTEGVMHNIPEISQKLEPIFNTLNSASDIGFSKKDPQAYTKLCEKLGIHPNETLFIDDKPENTEAAKAVGLETARYISIDHLRATLKTYGLV